MKKTRKGFTLVELLIVIVVIGILSAMMMMSSNEAITTAKANNIASNLRNLKTAALAYYTDHLTETYTDDADHRKLIFNYLSGKTHIPDSGDYSFPVVDGAKWYVTYTFNKNDQSRTTIKAKLKGRASSMGLLGGNQYQAYTDHDTISLRIR